MLGVCRRAHIQAKMTQKIFIVSCCCNFQSRMGLLVYMDDPMGQGRETE
jgi:hypothetical protein